MQAGIYFDGNAVSPPAFEDAVLRAAGGFERLGVREGNVVCLKLRNGGARALVVRSDLRAAARVHGFRLPYRAVAD